MKTFFTSIALLLFWGSAPADVVDFSQLSNDNASFHTVYEEYDIGYMIDGESPLETYIGGIFIDQITVNGDTTNLGDDIVTFCGALHDNWNGQYDYTGVSPLDAQSEIDKKVGLLCDLFYLGSFASDWEYGATVNETTYTKTAYYSAFQLAVWDITLGDDLSLTSDAGVFYYQSPSDLDTDAISLGDYMLQQVSISYSNEDDYTSQVFRLSGLVANGGSNQDLIAVSNIPEPASATLLICGITLLGLARRFLTA